MALSYAHADDATTTRTLWDFRKGFSSETVSNLLTDAANAKTWADNVDGGSTTANMSFASLARSEGPATATVGDETIEIEETSGLVFGATSSQHLNLVYTEAKGGYVWLNGKKAQDCVTIPNVPAGEKVTIMYESHKNTEARGFKVSTDGFADADGNTTFTTKENRDTVVLINNTGADSDLKLSATNGFHINYICIGEMPEDEPEAAKKVAYLYDGSATSLDADAAYSIVEGVFPDMLGSTPEITAVNVADGATDITVDYLKGFDAVVVSSSMSASNAAVATLKEAIAWVPMLNLNADLYAQWGYGSAVAASTANVTVASKYQSNSWFKNSETGDSYVTDGVLAITGEGTAINAVSLASDGVFANDIIIATVDDATAIHQHLTRNIYMYLPYTSDAVNASECAGDVIAKVLVTLVNSKAEDTKATAPQILFEYHDMSNTVTLKEVTTNSTIYYTLDGSEPTESSTVYTEPFEVSTEGVTVKAVAIAEGYLLSDVKEAEVKLYHTTGIPTISTEQGDGTTTITITPAAEGDVIYYNYTGSSLINASSVYTGPITVTNSCTITAFTGPNEEQELLQSDAVSQDITVNGETVRTKQIDHMDASSVYGTNNLYYFGKKGYPYYTDEVISTSEDAEGNIVNEYAVKDSVSYYNPGYGWEIVSAGQPAIYQSLSVGSQVGDPSGYNPAAAEDAVNDPGKITGNAIQFLTVSQSNGDGVKDPVTLYMQSTNAFQGPFDIVAFLSGKGGSVEVSVCTDTLAGEWTVLDTLYTPNVDADEKGRLYARQKTSYEGSEAVFVKFASTGKACRIFDIYIFAEDTEGIQNVSENNGEAVRTEVYNISGYKTNSLQRGVNIIRRTFSDGSTKTMKVLVK